MKRLILIMVFSLFLSIGLSVNAENVTTTISDNTENSDTLIDAGLIPGDFFYGFDRFFENVSLFFTFNNEKKVEKYSRYAEERLAELNKISLDKQPEWVDKLFDDYGVSLNNANNLLSDMITKGNVKQSVIEKLQITVENVTSKEDLIKSNTKEKINQEIKNVVQGLKVQTYLTTICEGMTTNDIELLDNQNVSNHNKVIIKALADLSDISISDIINLDIYLPDDPTTSIIEKNLDIDKLDNILGIDKEQLIQQLIEFHKTLVQKWQAEKESQNAQSHSGKTQEEIDQMKEEAQEKQEEAQLKQDQIKEKIQEKINQNGNIDHGNDGSKNGNGNKH